MTGRSIMGAVLAFSLLLAGGSRSKACTNIIVTREPALTIRTSSPMLQTHTCFMESYITTRQLYGSREQCSM